jgi:hypothetical protein
MDEFFVQLSELARAGWTFQIAPEPRSATMLATRGVILWTYTRGTEDDATDESPTYPSIDWINLFAPEIELRQAVAKMHASNKPHSGFGRAVVVSTPRARGAA